MKLWFQYWLYPKLCLLGRFPSGPTLKRSCHSDLLCECKMVGRGKLTPGILISCQMCKRVGSSGAVTVYLLGNHVFLECICCVLPWGGRPSSDCGWRHHRPWIESALAAECSPDTIYYAKSVRSAISLKAYTHQEASLSQPSAASTTTAVIRS